MSSLATLIPESAGARHALEQRARLYARRPAAVRRHALRVVSRTAILMAGDVVALLFTRWLLRVVTALGFPSTAAQWEQVGPLATPGRPASLVFGVSLMIGLLITGSYARYRPATAAARIGLAVALAFAAAATTLAAVIGIGAALFQAAVVALATWIALVGLRGIGERFLVRVWPRNRWAASAVVVTASRAEDPSIGEALAACGGDYATVATLAPGANLAANLRELLYSRDIEAVVIGDTVSSRDIPEVLDVALGAGCQLLCPARTVDTHGLHPRLVWRGGEAFLELGPLALRPSSVVAKRVMDVIGSGLLLLVSGPLMLLIAVAVRLDSPGPVLFGQERAGLGGRRFRMLKFRTMHDGADEQKQDLAHLNHTGDWRLFKIPADPRVTRLGRTLRRWSLDELPQLWNVLRGEMSLVGPRPFFEADFRQYEDHHFRRLDTKPGVTGLWQVSGRSDVVDFETVIVLDKQYIERWSFSLDLSILLRTIPAVVRRKGAF